MDEARSHLLRNLRANASHLSLDVCVVFLATRVAQEDPKNNSVFFANPHTGLIKIFSLKKALCES